MASGFILPRKIVHDRQNAVYKQRRAFILLC